MTHAVKDPPPPIPPLDPDTARASLGSRRVGPHLPIRHGLPAVADRAWHLGSGVIQVFTGDPRAWEARAEPPPGVDELRVALGRHDILLVTHASYLVNLAGPDDAARARAIDRMRREMAAAAAFGARVVTVHVGSHKGAGVEVGIERAGESVARILDGLPHDASSPRIALEDSAGQGDAIGVSVEELGSILAAAERHGADPARMGICLDTAHLWGAGVPLDDGSEVDRLMDATQRCVGQGRLLLIHLNDSQARGGSRTDRHEHIGDGAIGRASLGRFLAHPLTQGVPVVLETPGIDDGWDAVDMARVRELLEPGGGAHRPGGARVHRTSIPSHRP